MGCVRKQNVLGVTDRDEPKAHAALVHLSITSNNRYSLYNKEIDNTITAYNSVIY